MKKLIFTVAVIFALGIVFTSCKETKKEEHKTEGQEHDADHKEHKGEEMAHTFQCPMDCEKGKTYEAKGSCPVCKMDLKEKKADSDSEHADGCKCKEGGECKCEDGKCECKAEMASNEMECTKCEDGKCECKS